MNAASLTSSDPNLDMVNKVIQDTLFATFANVITVLPPDKDGSDVVKVQGAVCNGTSPVVTTAKVVYPTNAKIQIRTAPIVGDKVLLIGLQSYSENQFLTKMTLTEAPINNVKHYALSGCIAIPLNVNTLFPIIQVDTDLTGTKMTIGRPGTELSADPVVRWSELNTALQAFVTLLNSHVHSGGTIEGSTGTPSVELSLDITAAQSDILAVPGVPVGGA